MKNLPLTDRVNVPCGLCHACCHSMVQLFPEKGDDISSYKTMLWLNAKGGPIVVLDRKENGDCVYLTENGCAIHDRAPWTCRSFDCRKVWLDHDRKGRRLAIKTGEMSKEIFDRGRELLEMGRR